MVKYISRLFVKDSSNILSEPVLLYIAFAPIIFCYGIKFLILYLNPHLIAHFDLLEYGDLIISIVLIVIAIIIGTLAGFMILDEKDEGTILALVVTPLGKKGYLIYKLIFSIFMSFVFSSLCVPIIDVIKIPYINILPVSMLIAIEAPICALVITSIANNKVEGLAVAKGLVLCVVVPLCTYFFGGDWDIILGVVPFYWPTKAILINDISNIYYWLYILIGFIEHVITLHILCKLFYKKW